MQSLMAVILTVLLLTAQLLPVPAPDPPRLGSAASQRRDLEFQDAVEQFVRLSRPGHVPPVPYRAHLAQLGDPCYRCRDRAAAMLAELCRDDNLRWLMWGRHSVDPEVRLRCNNLLRDLTRCGMCGGSGLCREFRGPDPGANWPDGGGACTNCGLWPWGHQESPGECWACSGRGCGWAKGAFE